MKKHDENNDIKILSRKCLVDTRTKSIKAAKSTILGNKSWGRIDYLTHYCGYVFIWDNTVVTPAFTTTANSEKKTIKKQKVVNNLKKK